MYLFEKPYTFYPYPYPHLIINGALPNEIADQLAESYPTDLGWGTSEYNAIKYPDNDVWKKFYEVNLEKNLPFIIDLLDRAFDKPSEKVVVKKVNYNYYKDSDRNMLRDWHVDSAEKKYQILLYLGSVERGGELEMWDRKETKTVPFAHNRLVAWYNNRDSTKGTLTEHRYFSCKGERKVFNIPIIYP
jgi:hypothetical protein